MILSHEMIFHRHGADAWSEYRIRYLDGSLFLADVRPGQPEPDEVLQLKKWLAQRD